MSRRLAREVALRTLYQLDVGHVSKDEALNYALEVTPIAAEHEAFARQLIDKAIAHTEQADQIISRRSVDWDIRRLPRVDRAILRLSLAELLDPVDAPTGVVISEAVELANKYSTDESGRFINGILGSYVREEDNA